MLQLVVLLARIELHDNVALLHQLARGSEMGNLQRVAANRRSDQHGGIDGVQLTHRVNLQVDAAALHEGQWDIIVRFGQTHPVRSYDSASRRDQHSRRNSPLNNPLPPHRVLILTASPSDP